MIGINNGVIVGTRLPFTVTTIAGKAHDHGRHTDQR